MHDNSRKRSRAGLTLVEIVVVVLILAVLAGVVVPQVRDRQKSARDARRLADMRTLRDAIEQYHLDRGVLPAHEANPDFDGWDVSHDGGFFDELLEAGYLRDPVGDPINDDGHHYGYRVYPRGSFGCAGDGDFYVLGIRSFELAGTAAANHGSFRCPNRDFGTRFDYVTGGGVSRE